MKKVSIVFTETGIGKFTVALEGVSPERLAEGGESGEGLSAAEFHGSRCFRIVVAALAKAGAIQPPAGNS